MNSVFVHFFAKSPLFCTFASGGGLMFNLQICYTTVVLANYTKYSFAENGTSWFSFFLITACAAAKRAIGTR